MLVKESNREKIEEMIKKAEGRARARTINYNDMTTALKKIEDRLRIKKKDMIGIRARVDIHAQNFPQAYRYYRPESTHFFVTKKSSGWDLTDVDRDWTRREGHGVVLYLPDETCKAIIQSNSEF